MSPALHVFAAKLARLLPIGCLQVPHAKKSGRSLALVFLGATINLAIPSQEWRVVHRGPLRGPTRDERFSGVVQIEVHRFIESGCLVLDVRMPGMSGLTLLGLLPKWGITLPAIMISGYGDVPLAVRAMRAGAIDFLEKPIRAQDLLEQINTALELDAKRWHGDQRRREAAERYDRLTPREREVLTLLVIGRTSKQIAEELGISPKTVEKFRERAMRKMAVSNVVELVLVAYRLALVKLPASLERPGTAEFEENDG